MSVQRTTRFIINLIIFGSSKALNIYNIMDDIFTQELDGQYTELNPNPSYKTQIIHNIFGTKPPNENIEYTNTDKFYSNVYEYYYNNGYYTVLASHISEIISLIFGIVFSIFVFVFLDWDRILQCGNNNEIKECGELYTYISPKIPNFLTSIILVSSIIFTIVKFCIFIIKYKDLVNTYNYYTNSLHISCEELQTSTWTKIVNKIIEVNAKNITICDITNKILRTDNYFIALIHKDIIKLPSISLYTSQLDFNLRHIILNDIVNIDHGTLKRRFILYGLLNLLFSVIIFIYLSMHFFASNIDEFYSNKDILGSRKYTIYAKWKFREYNELKHFFEKRLTKSMPVGVSYIKNFPAPTTEVICKNIGIICGAFIGFFVILSLLDESILLYVRLFDRTLLFYAGIIGAISSIARGTIRKPENTIYNPAAIMEKIYKYTHYMPDRWKKKTNTYAVKDDFLKLFPYSFILFLYELLSVFTTPYILLFILPKQSIDITYFIKNHTVKSQNVGPICRFANFETPDQNNDRKMDQSLSYFTEMNSIEYESSLQVTNIA